MLFEIIVISVIGMTLALGVGSLLANQMSETMLINELQTNRDNTPIRTGLAGIPEIDAFFTMGIPTVELTIEDMMVSFDNSLETNTIMMFYLTGLTTVILATSVSVVYIVKMKPKKILLG
jgi:putative ABC transport system permease protein